MTRSPDIAAKNTVIAPTTDELADALRPFAKSAKSYPISNPRAWICGNIADDCEVVVQDLINAFEILARHDHFKRDGFDGRNSKSWDARDDSKPGRERIEA